MNNTETKLSDICKKNKWYVQKLNTHTSTGFGTNQVSDFLVANNKGVYAIECKERKNYFYMNDLTQSLQMKKLLKKSNKFIPFVLLNFYGVDKLFLFPYRDFLYFKNSIKFKNGKQKKGINSNDVPLHYLIKWQDINKVI